MGQHALENAARTLYSGLDVKNNPVSVAAEICFIRPVTNEPIDHSIQRGRRQSGQRVPAFAGL